MLLLAPLDRGIRGIARNYLRSITKIPSIFSNNYTFSQSPLSSLQTSFAMEP
jgi:hypothetical protein